MDNYEGAFEIEMQPAESSLTKSVKRYSASIPSAAYFGVAIGTLVLALACQLAGRGKWSNFLVQCMSACLIVGAYEKFVKFEGYEQSEPGHNRGYTS